MTRILVVALLLSAQERKGPLPPEEARKAIKLDAGLRVELVACEPEVESPVSAQFDENGRLWVVEMLDYPTPDPSKPPLGRVKVLEDGDGDGRYERATVFADQLLLANGVLPWKGGAVVTAAPNVLYLPDADGDLKADRKDVLYEGFATQNPQLRVSQPTLGIDNGIYVANGLRSTRVKKPGGKPIEVNGQDFRFDLIRGAEEAVSGQGQFGLTFDDWGQRFVCTNRNHLNHLPMPNRYFARNPFMPAPEPVRDNNQAGGAARVYPISRNKTLAASHAGTFTASCGVTVYRGDLLPAEYRGSVLTCEPTGNLVHREILTPRGATFDGRPAKPGVEFLASPDEWFRPVNMTHGPDGALYVVDMARSEVEHPEWVPADLRHRYDFSGPKHFGRIWRVVPEGYAGKPPRVAMGKEPAAELVAALESPNAWRRMTAHRLLLERQEAAAVEPLRKHIFQSGEPLARLHSGWLLEGLAKLDVDSVVRLLGDAHPRVRESAVRLSEPFLASPRVHERVLELAGDGDARVRFQVALSLGEWNDPRVVEALARVALGGAEDRWTRLAVASASPERAGRVVKAVLARAEKPSPERLLVVRELSALAGARRDPGEVADLLEALLAQEAVAWPLAALNGLAEGMGRRGAQLGAFLASLPAERKEVAARAKGLLEKAAAVASDAGRSTVDRLDAVRLLAHVPWGAAGPVLATLLESDPLQEVRLAAIAALSAHKGPGVAEALMKPFKRAMPAVRREILEAMGRQPDRVEFLLKEIEAERLAPGELGPALIRQLTNHSKADLRERAKKLLADSLPEERKRVLDRYKAAVGMRGDAARGKAVFQKNCATCHRVGAVGVHVGPDVSDTLSKAKDVLLTDILDPSRAIDNNYVNYIVKKKDGTVLSGFIAAQTASSLTLRRAEGQEDVVLRQDIEEMKSSGISLMPEGLEKGITVEEMADLLAFLKNWRDLPE